LPVRVPYPSRVFDLLAKDPFGKHNLHQNDAVVRSLRGWRGPRPLFDDKFYGLEAFLPLFIRAVADADEAVTILSQEFFRTPVLGSDCRAGAHAKSFLFSRGEYKAKIKKVQETPVCLRIPGVLEISTKIPGKPGFSGFSMFSSLYPIPLIAKN